MSARLSKSDRKIMFARELRKRERAARQERFHFSGNIQSLPAAKTDCIDDWFTGLSLVVRAITCRYFFVCRDNGFVFVVPVINKQSILFYRGLM